MNGVDYEGSVLVYEKLIMSWSPKKISEITQERYALKLFRHANALQLLMGCLSFVHGV